MNEKEFAKKREEYLNRIDLLYDAMSEQTKRFREEQKQIRIALAKTIEEAKLECDLGIADISRHTNKTRQAIHKLTKEAFGVRHPDKAEAALQGHRNRGWKEEDAGRRRIGNE